MPTSSKYKEYREQNLNEKHSPLNLITTELGSEFTTHTSRNTRATGANFFAIFDSDLSHLITGAWYMYRDTPRHGRDVHGFNLCENQDTTACGLKDVWEGGFMI